MISDETVLKAAKVGWPNTFAFVQKQVRRALEAVLPDIEATLREKLGVETSYAEELEAALAERDKEIERLDVDLRRSDRRVRDLEQEWAERDGEIAEYQEEVNNWKQITAGRDADCVERDKEIERLKCELESVYSKRRTPTELTKAAMDIHPVERGALWFVDRTSMISLVNQASVQLQEMNERLAERLLSKVEIEALLTATKGCEYDDYLQRQPALVPAIAKLEKMRDE